jgi:hypothetical protein
MLRQGIRGGGNPGSTADRYRSPAQRVARSALSSINVAAWREVGTEKASGVGTRIDVVVRQGNEFWFYEIKTAQSPRACLREALGQLPEYAFWPGAQAASRLIVVGESAIDDDGSEYLRRLRDRFGLPIEYEQISI